MQPGVPQIHVSDYLSRLEYPDLYPRKEDPYRPDPAPSPAGYAEIPVVIEPGQGIRGVSTNPGARPSVFQRGGQFNVAIGTTPVPLVTSDFPADSFILNVYSSAANSVFLGFGGALTLTSGLEVRAGTPAFFGADNTREMWELQRTLEILVALAAANLGQSPILNPYKAPRVVLDLSDFYVIAAAPTVATVLWFAIPESQ